MQKKHAEKTNYLRTIVKAELLASLTLAERMKLNRQRHVCIFLSLSFQYVNLYGL